MTLRAHISHANSHYRLAESGSRSGSLCVTKRAHGQPASQSIEAPCRLAPNPTTDSYRYRYMLSRRENQNKVGGGGGVQKLQLAAPFSIQRGATFQSLPTPACPQVEKSLHWRSLTLHQNITGTVDYFSTHPNPTFRVVLI